MRERLGRRGTAGVVLAVGLGGALGGLARYGLSAALPHGAVGFPWATFLANTVGSFAIGVLMVLLAETARPHRLLRPFLGVGFLGGFTTFSTYAVDVLALVEVAAPHLALGYLTATVPAALAAAYAGIVLTRLLLGYWHGTSESATTE